MKTQLLLLFFLFFLSLSSSAAEELQFPNEFQKVWGSSEISCGATEDGQTLCWRNHAQDSPDIRWVPTAAHVCQHVPELDGLVKYCAAGGYACGLLATGSLVCSGNNDEGQLGQGDQVPRSQFVTVMQESVVDVTCLHHAVCAIQTVDGLNRRFCWGANNVNNGLGTRITAENILEPALVVDPSEAQWDQLTSGLDSLICASAPGVLQCWHRNAGAANQRPVFDPVTLLDSDDPALPDKRPGERFLADDSSVCGVTSLEIRCSGPMGPDAIWSSGLLGQFVDLDVSGLLANGETSIVAADRLAASGGHYLQHLCLVTDGQTTGFYCIASRARNHEGRVLPNNRRQTQTLVEFTEVLAVPVRDAYVTTDGWCALLSRSNQLRCTVPGHLDYYVGSPGSGDLPAWLANSRLKVTYGPAGRPITRLFESVADHVVAELEGGLVATAGRRIEQVSAEFPGSPLALTLAPSLHGAKTVCTGTRHACALFPSGRVSCGGANEVAQLGVGHRLPVFGWHEVYSADSGVVDLACAGRATCALKRRGVSAVIRECWGFNGDNELAFVPPTNLKVQSRPKRIGRANDEIRWDSLHGSGDETNTLFCSEANNHRVFRCWGSSPGPYNQVDPGTFFNGPVDSHIGKAANYLPAEVHHLANGAQCGVAVTGPARGVRCAGQIGDQVFSDLTTIAFPGLPDVDTVVSPLISAFDGRFCTIIGGKLFCYQKGVVGGPTILSGYGNADVKGVGAGGLFALLANGQLVTRLTKYSLTTVSPPWTGTERVTIEPERAPHDDIIISFK